MTVKINPSLITFAAGLITVGVGVGTYIFGLISNLATSACIIGVGLFLMVVGILIDEE